MGSSKAFSIVAALALLTASNGCELKAPEPPPVSPGWRARGNAPVAKPEAAVSPAVKQSEQRHTVAKLVEAISDVKARKADELIWTPAREKMTLDNHDAIKTGSDSSGLIRFNDATSLSVGEDSLVIVVDRAMRRNAEKSIVALPAGRFEGELKKNSPVPVELVVKTPRGWIEAANTTDTRFRAELSRRGRLQVSSYAGELKLVTADKEKTVHPRESLTLPASSKAPIDPEKFSTSALNSPPKLADAEWSRVKVAKIVAAEKFRILSPSGETPVHSASVQVTGVVPSSQKAYFDGKLLQTDASGEFKVNAKLHAGLNVLTFQVIGPSDSDVRYETLELMCR